MANYQQLKHRVRRKMLMVPLLATLASQGDGILFGLEIENEIME